MTDISMGVFCADLYHQAFIADQDLKFTVHESEHEVPTDYDEVVRLFLSGQPYRVYGGASDRSVYAVHGGDVAANHRFRAVHDFLHFSFNHDFTIRSETNLGLLHAFQCRCWLRNDPTYRQYADDAAHVLLADTLGQTWVYHVTQGFVDDQCEFVERVLCTLTDEQFSSLIGMLNQPIRALEWFDTYVCRADILHGLSITRDEV